MSKKTHKRTAAQREKDLLEIESLHFGEGWTHQTIADHLNAIRPYTLSRRQIGKDAEKVLDRLRLQFLGRDSETFIVIELKKLERLEREAWIGWEESKSSQSKQGDPRFLNILLNISKQRSELMGITKLMFERHKQEEEQKVSQDETRVRLVYDLGPDVNGNSIIVEW